jgi:hypothetical protein
MNKKSAPGSIRIEERSCSPGFELNRSTLMAAKKKQPSSHQGIVPGA